MFTEEATRTTVTIHSKKPKKRNTVRKRTYRQAHL